MDIDKIAKRASQEIRAGQVINLGIGLPTMVMEYLPDDLEVLIHSENGVLGTWKKTPRELARPQLIDAGGNYITMRDGGSIFDSAVSFAIIRRAKLDLSIMGAFEVDQQGNLANWKIPGRFSPGIGGAMELAQKTTKVIVLCTHNDKYGKPKILRNCTLPLTGAHCVSRIITDKAVMDVSKDGLILREMSSNMELIDLISQTEADLIIPNNMERF
ncbi:MAG: acyl CoA:acetate/3-ketoacid CoA transferase subunit beta [Alphaproteobacteria bacterium]|nr:MAG: acyl CoA:acetate/3-ketoacid CoA transferase subunit beta [Alphaproteobacteria bacterium]